MRILVLPILALALAGCAARPPSGTALPPTSGPADLGSRWIDADARRAAAAGAGAVSLVATGAGAPGDNLGGRIDVPQGSCALILARGSPSLEDLDVFVYAEDGTALGEDQAPGPTASVVVCPPHPAHLYAFARVAAGHGLLAVSAQIVAPANSESVAHAVGATGSLHEQPVTAEGFPGLDAALAAHRRAIGGSWRDARRTALPLDPRVPTQVSAVVEAGRCLDAFVVPSEDVAFVELTVLDLGGRILGRAPSEVRMPSVVACVPARTELAFELRPHAGRGLAALILSVTDDPKAVAPSSRDVFVYEAITPKRLDEARAELSSTLTRRGYPPPRSVAHGELAVGVRQSRALDLPDGCSRLDAVLGAPAQGVGAWLWSADGALIAHDEGTLDATLFACGAVRSARLEIEGITRAGPYDVELSTASDTAPALARSPLAAGRLLARLDARERIATPRDIRTAEVVSLAAEKRVTRELRLDKGQCVDVGLGLGPGAEGAEIRLFDAEATDAAELALARGTTSALAEACALDRRSSLRVGIEARVVTGVTEAVLASRVRAAAAPPESGH
jgi:hypothetical protein